jgi:outer membrane protein TolC
MVLIEPLTVEKIIEPLEADQVLAQRPEIQAAKAALAEAEADARLQDVAARLDLNVTCGYKRTELPDTIYGVNTAIVAVRVTLPVTDRNRGNRAAAEAEVRRRQDLVVAAENDIRMELQRRARRVSNAPRGGSERAGPTEPRPKGAVRFRVR